MTIYLIPNLTKPQAASTAAAAVDVLCAQGAQVILPADVPQQPFAGKPVAFLEETSAFSGCDAIVTIGGDGTILRGAASGSTSPCWGSTLAAWVFLPRWRPMSWINWHGLCAVIISLMSARFCRCVCTAPTRFASMH